MLHLTLLSLLFIDYRPQTIEPAKQFAPAKKIVRVPPQQGWTKTQITYKDGGPRSKPARDRELYVHYSQEAKQVVDKMVQVTANEKERSDLKALAFQLRAFNDAVNDYDYKKADDIWERMQPTLYRCRMVAGVAEKRKSDWARADAERRHQEKMAQEERHHREWIRRSTIPQPVIIGNPRGRF
jgi:hypothetical protein